MNINTIKKELKTNKYSFISSDEHLGSNVILLGLGGSHAYGTNTEGSDLDIRGIALNTKREILLGEDFEQVTNIDTDTIIYSFNKIVKLLSNCNPNTIEILGLNDDQYLYMSYIGNKLKDNVGLFLSKRAVQSFGGYANSQLRRLMNKSSRSATQEEKEKNILNSIKTAAFTFPEKYFEYPEDAIKLYVDKSNRDNMDSEIFMDVNLKHYPLRDYKAMWAEMSNVVKDYDKLGSRNQKAIEHSKLGKHMMHLIRLYLMCFDILEKGEINTYRGKEHDWLMDIRNGKYLIDNKPTNEFIEIVNELENKLQKLAKTASLPDTPDYNKINDFVAEVNEWVIKSN